MLSEFEGNIAEAMENNLRVSIGDYSNNDVYFAYLAYLD